MIFPTYGSVFACILLSSIFMIIVCLLSNKINFILKNSANLLVFFMVMIMFRMFFTCNFSFTKNIYSTHTLTAICDILMKYIWKDYKVSDVIITIWLLISIFLLCRLIYTQIQFNRFLLVLTPDDSKEIKQVYQSVQNNRKCKLKIYKIQGIKSPCITGLIHPKILLPQIEFTPKELHYILQHELQHYYHHDLWLNMLCEIIMCFYWWNPLAYLLKERFRDMLEFANDQKITESMNEIEVYEYLECILKIIKTNKIHKKLPAICFIGCGRSTFQQRFDLITKSQHKKYGHKGYVLYSIIFVICYILSFVFVFEPKYTRPHQKSKEAIYDLEEENTFFVKSKGGYKIYYKGKFVGRCESLETFQGYRVYKNDKEAKENEEIK